MDEETVCRKLCQYNIWTIVSSIQPVSTGISTRTRRETQLVPSAKTTLYHYSHLAFVKNKKQNQDQGAGNDFVTGKRLFVFDRNLQINTDCNTLLITIWLEGQPQERCRLHFHSSRYLWHWWYYAEQKQQTRHFHHRQNAPDQGLCLIPLCELHNPGCTQ